MARPMEIVMKPFLLAALQTLLKALIGALNYEQIRELVNDADREPMTGDEKRAWVIQEARTLGLAIGNALLNLAIETAVNSLRK